MQILKSALNIVERRFGFVIHSFRLQGILVVAPDSAPLQLKDRISWYMAFNRGARGLLPQAHDLDFRGLSASRSNLENLPPPGIEKVHGSQLSHLRLFHPDH